MAQGSNTPPSNLQSYLKGIAYRASKQDLMDCAHRNGAPDDVLDLIAGMPEQEFDGPQDVQKAYGRHS
jgi:hypothetical protein